MQLQSQVEHLRAAYSNAQNQIQFLQTSLVRQGEQSRHHVTPPLERMVPLEVLQQAIDRHNTQLNEFKTREQSMSREHQLAIESLNSTLSSLQETNKEINSKLASTFQTADTDAAHIRFLSTKNQEHTLLISDLVALVKQQKESMLQYKDRSSQSVKKWRVQTEELETCRKNNEDLIGKIKNMQFARDSESKALAKVTDQFNNAIIEIETLSVKISQLVHTF